MIVMISIYYFSLLITYWDEQELNSFITEVPILQTNPLICSAMDRVLCDRDLRHERVKYRLRMSTASFQCILNILTPDIEKKNPTNLDMFSITPDRQPSFAINSHQYAYIPSKLICSEFQYLSFRFLFLNCSYFAYLVYFLMKQWYEVFIPKNAFCLTISMFFFLLLRNPVFTHYVIYFTTS